MSGWNSRFILSTILSLSPIYVSIFSLHICCVFVFVFVLYVCCVFVTALTLLYLIFIQAVHLLCCSCGHTLCLPRNISQLNEIWKEICFCQTVYRRLLVIAYWCQVNIWSIFSSIWLFDNRCWVISSINKHCHITCIWVQIWGKIVFNRKNTKHVDFLPLLWFWLQQ